MLDIRLNNIMKIFTVLSAVFLPLTLITGWYGMNFTAMPELTWRYGYLYVLILAAAVALICIGIFKRRHWL
jgi:magnesium transporter